jgi:hypothetical protein
LADGLDTTRLIDVMLLGRNKKGLRVASALLVKGIYDVGRNHISKVLLHKLSSLSTFGVNSYEFISVLSYIVNQEAELNLNETEKRNIASQIF